MADTVSRIAAIEANMERARRADEVKPAWARCERWLKEAPVRKEQIGRFKPRIVSGMPMTSARREGLPLRSCGHDDAGRHCPGIRRRAGFMETVVETLRTFLTENEMGHCARSWRVGQGSLDGQPRYDHHLAQRGGRTR